MNMFEIHTVRTITGSFCVVYDCIMDHDLFVGTREQCEKFMEELMSDAFME